MTENVKKQSILDMIHFLSFFKKIPISIIIKVIELFLLDNKNAIEIKTKIKDLYH